MRKSNSKQPVYCALATDGDGTLVKEGRMASATVAALKRWRESGRKLILTTGEIPKDVAKFPHVDLFDLVVAENGALLYDPATKKEQVLAVPPPARLVRALKQAKIDPLRQGRVMLATKNSQEKAVEKVLAELHTDWRIQRNRKNVMILPDGVNKASGLAAALKRMRLSPDAVLAMGDAENDVALFQECGCGVAVANALPKLKKQAQYVTHGSIGRGVVEMVKKICDEEVAVPAA